MDHLHSQTSTSHSPPGCLQSSCLGVRTSYSSSEKKDLKSTNFETKNKMSKVACARRSSKRSSIAVHCISTTNIEGIVGAGVAILTGFEDICLHVVQKKSNG